MLQAEIPDDARHLILLTELGDIEVSWDPENDEVMRALIQRKIDEGMSFFTLKPIIHSSFYQKKRLTSVRELNERRIKVNDADLERVFSAGQASLARVEGVTKYDTGERLKSADKVTKAKAAVGFKPLRGG